MTNSNPNQQLAALGLTEADLQQMRAQADSRHSSGGSDESGWRAPAPRVGDAASLVAKPQIFSSDGQPVSNRQVSRPSGALAVKLGQQAQREREELQQQAAEERKRLEEQSPAGMVARLSFLEREVKRLSKQIKQQQQQEPA